MTIMTLKSIVCAAACLLITPAAIAQQSTRPEIGPAPSFELPDTSTVTLENGLEVTFIDFGLAPKVNISIRVMAGNVFDGEATYLADVAAAMMEEGAGGESPDSIARAFASMGGDMNVGVGMHTTNFSANVLSEFGPEAIARMASVIREPDFPESEFDRILQNQIRNMTVARSQPGPVATEAYVGLLYGTDHPYGQGMPDVGQMDGYTLDQVREFYDDNFGAGRTRIYIAGRFDHAEMEAAIREAFGDWEGGPQVDIPPATPRSGPIVRLIDRPGAPQTTIRLGAPVAAIGSDDAYSMAVMNAILGGSFTSRLVRNLRETNGWTYSPGSGVSNLMGSSYWTFNADIITEHTIEAFTEIFSEIQQLQLAAPSDEEAGGMRTWLGGIFILQNASTGGLIGQIANQDLYGLPGDYLDTYVERINAVSNADISAVAEEYLQSDRLVLVVVGDLAQIEDGLRAFPQLADAEFITDAD
ncbi:pitrilysin family protein [Hyphobacterium sp. HN65]|uniref:Pitrilysin family protein n=1 Tax=Hyphobacterium lacteum TaxID=3116575 RepID=A0ABU7LN30_9PROT|nr:pitrilysin family protein [Hyphobacterium sp. HN65]MEE2525321.1 pitrilysin family protein [Hyphobacterium sp. HN65]